MMLRCDFCMRKCSGVIKVPSGYFVNVTDTEIIFTMPTGESSYSNMCLNCVCNRGEKGN